jgi:hypothetical protein
MPCSPRSRIPLASVAAGLMTQQIRLDRMCHRQLDPATGVRTTRFCRTLQRRTSCATGNAHEFTSPCIHLPRRRCCVHHIPPRVRDDRDTPLLPRRDSAEIATDLGSMESDISLQGWLDDPNQFESIQQIRFYAQRLFGPIAEDKSAGIVISCRRSPELAPKQRVIA